MKVESCKFQHSLDGITRQCLLPSDHTKPHPEDGLKGRRQLGSKKHELAPLCKECGHPKKAFPGMKENERWAIE